MEQGGEIQEKKNVYAALLHIMDINGDRWYWTQKMP